ncbi:MAG TPA: hypothetical protein VGL66_15750 [Caulobacteraceae bacterium]|jgi:hypothetical protein
MRTGMILVLAAGLSALGACKAPPPPLKDVSYPAWGFAVSFHGTPKATDSPAAADGSTAHTFVVESAVEGRDELVNVIDGSASTKSEDQALSDAPAVLAKAVGATLGPITYAASGKVMGREFLLTRPGHPAGRARVFVVNKHLYEIVGESAQGPDDPAVAAFLDSFRLL